MVFKRYGVRLAKPLPGGPGYFQSSFSSISPGALQRRGILSIPRNVGSSSLFLIHVSYKDLLTSTLSVCVPR